ncbi:type II toxin-antitoxin system RelE/ParE family toxin [Peteryoungia ipomoeae]|uniref:Type II toxin-antitoxin system RelE/ParE family toxin n=1 Tax=Peteryoungia ipomoeae TaxID=1210932 RepID=A0A4S8P1D3_9HYPH|nr:type II toxin-antitoxin system RelE/ParE family toxin [Peteryoungia ipomoeae]THV21404.1 type II toxin-antitoxin system RelE/ParE family toxin [Peteryoungia ipomoeae]
MKRYAVRLVPSAEKDLRNIYLYVRSASASPVIARGYVLRIRRFLEAFQTFPMRGSLRNDIREGLRVVGFERHVSIAFLVEGEEVIILRIASHGQELEV